MTLKERINVFLSRYSLSTHSLVVASAFLITLYYNVPQVHDYVYGVYTGLPKGLKSLIAAVIAAVIWYYRGKRIWTPEERAEKAPVAAGDSAATMTFGSNVALISKPVLEPEEVPPPPPPPQNNDPVPAAPMPAAPVIAPPPTTTPTTAPPAPPPVPEVKPFVDTTVPAAKKPFIDTKW